MLRPVAVLVLLLLAAPALGQPPAPGLPPPLTERIVMRLDFAGVPGCSDPEPFVLALTPRVHGWDPLAPDGRWRLVVTIKKRAPGYEGTTELHDPKGDAVWSRPIPPKASCFILLDRLAYKTAFRIDPPGAPPPAAPAPPPPPAEPPKPPPEPVKPPAVPPPEPVKLEPVKVEPQAAPVPARFVPQVGLGLRMDFVATSALFEVTVEGGVKRQEWRRGGWSLMGTFRVAPNQPGIGPPTNGPAPDVTSSLLAGSLSGCVYYAWPVSLAGCVVGELGENQQSAGKPVFPSHQTVLFAGGGVSAHLEGPISDRYYFQVAADVRGVAKVAGSTSHWDNVTARSFGGAAGMLGVSAGIWF
jgi:hypothetical protein